MKEIKLVIDGKQYIKRSFTTGDWLALLEIADKAAKNEVSYAQLTEMRIEFIAKVMDISESELKEKADFAEIMNAYRDIDLELTSVFLGTPLKRTAAGGVEVAGMRK